MLQQNGYIFKNFYGIISHQVNVFTFLSKMCIRDSYNRVYKYALVFGKLFDALYKVYYIIIEACQLSLIHIQMCIRDRHKINLVLDPKKVQTKKSLLNYLIPQTQKKLKVVFLYPRAVSYTHLDVYKRQVISINTFPRKMI